MEQKIRKVFGADLGICICNMAEIIQQLNKEGFELTYVTFQSDNNKFSNPTYAILVFTKK